MAIANKQLEIMGRYMAELGMTPASRSRVAAFDPRMQVPQTIAFRTVYEAKPEEVFEVQFVAPERAAMKRQLPRCPPHLTRAAAAEWRRVAKALYEAGVLSTFDRSALAAYCQAYGRWVEAEERLRETSLLFRTPSGHVQQSPLLGIVHKQLELMGRYMVELGMTPAARSRVLAHARDRQSFPRAAAGHLSGSSTPRATRSVSGASAVRRDRDRVLDGACRAARRT